MAVMWIAGAVALTGVASRRQGGGGVATALRRRRSRPRTVRPPVQSIALIPAKDEGPTIAAAITSVRPQVDRVVVIANNCVDDTAARARAAGAEVVELHDGSTGPCTTCVPTG